MATFAEERGRRFISIGAAGNYGNVPANTGGATGAGDAVAVTWRNGQMPSRCVFDYRVSGGTFTALVVALQRSLDGGTNWDTIASGNVITGESVDVVDHIAGSLLRLNITTFTANTGTPVVEGGILIQ